jgi:transcriptional regulator with XRE-family HTH domain
MSILELSSDLDLSYRTVYNLVEGKLNPTLDTLIKTSKRFDIKISQVLGEVPLEEKNGSGFTKSVPLISWLEIENHLNYKKSNIKKDYPSLLISSEKMLSDKVFAVYSNINTEPLFKSGTILVFDLLLSNIQDYDNKFLLISASNSSLLIKKLIIESDKAFLQSISSSSSELFTNQFRILAYLLQARIELENR